MQYIVLDLEWNIPLNVHKVNPELLQSIPQEIIEIGAIRLDENFRRTGRFSVNVQPKYYTRLHHHIKKLTQRKNSSLRSGAPFPQAAHDFLTWVGEEEYLLCTWSSSDSAPWLTNLSHYGMTPTNIPRFLDVQRVYAMSWGEISTQRSVSYAMESLGIPLDEPFHKAVNDAYYTAKIMARTIEKLREEQDFPTDPAASFEKLRRYSYDPSIHYRAKADLGIIASPSELTDLLTDFVWLCPACNQPLRITSKWKLKRGGLRRSAKAKCEEHGDIAINCSTFRNKKQTDNDPWLVKADIHLQRPL